MNFTKLVLGDTLGDLDLNGLSMMGFQEAVPNSESSQEYSSDSDSQTQEFNLPVQYQLPDADADLTEKVYKFTEMFIPLSSEVHHRHSMLNYLNAITGTAQGDLKTQELQLKRKREIKEAQLLAAKKIVPPKVDFSALERINRTKSKPEAVTPVQGQGS